MATAAMSTVALLLRVKTPRQLARIPPPCVALFPPERRTWTRRQHQNHDSSSSSSKEEAEEESPERRRQRPPLSSLWAENPVHVQWKEKEARILRDVEPTISLAKDILHSRRYRDGEQLSDEDEKIVVEKILAYHPHSEDKVGCGIYSIMVDRHPEFKVSRCLFVVRTDGGWIDFSYQKCLKAYIREKYPLEAERFIKHHFKRT